MFRTARYEMQFVNPASEEAHVLRVSFDLGTSPHVPSKLLARLSSTYASEHGLVSVGLQELQDAPIEIELNTDSTW